MIPLFAIPPLDAHVGAPEQAPFAVRTELDAVLAEGDRGDRREPGGSGAAGVVLAGCTRRPTLEAHCTAPADGGPGPTGPRPAARGGMHAPEPAPPQLPAWLRRTRGEHRWPAALAVVVAIGLQLVLPDRMVPQVHYLLLALEGALLVALVVANPFRINRESALLRTAGLALTTLVGLSNGWSAVLLVLDLVAGGLSSPAELLTAGGAIWLTNVLAFALVYWELDRGGPAARAAATHVYPDFLFAQMQGPQLADPDWEPQFIDYLYLAFTNATAFSPTDVLPLSRWAKVTMMVQSAVALAVVVLVVARAVNVLG